MFGRAENPRTRSDASHARYRGAAVVGPLAGAHRSPKMAAAGAIFWWMVNSVCIGEQRLLNHRSLPGHLSIGG